MMVRLGAETYTSCILTSGFILLVHKLVNVLIKDNCGIII
jgi:hypothetical protein